MQLQKKIVNPACRREVERVGRKPCRIEKCPTKQFLAAESFGEASKHRTGPNLSFISWQGTSEAHTS